MLSCSVQLLSSSHIVVSIVVNLCSYVTMLGLFLLFCSFSTFMQTDLVLVTSLEDNTVPVFEVYNPKDDRVGYK